MKGKVVRASLIVLSTLALLAAITLNMFAAIPGAKGIIFNQTTGEISNQYNLTLIPPNETFQIWTAIYSWLFLAQCYLISTIFVKSTSGERLYNTDVYSPLYHLLFILNMVANVVWIFLWSMDLLTESLIVLCILTFLTYCCIITSHITLSRSEDNYSKAGRVNRWVIEILIHNGLTFYGAWTTIACGINFAMVLYKNGFLLESSHDDDELITIVVLGIIALEIMVYFILEMLVFRERLVVTYSHYIVLIIAFSGIISKEGIQGSVMILLAGVVVEFSTFLLVKIINGVYVIKKHFEPERI